VHHEIRQANDARQYVMQGLHLQCFLHPAPGTVREILEWSLEIASAGHPLPPLGFLADLAHMALGKPGRQHDGLARAQVPGLSGGLLRAYEDHVLGKVVADATLDRAADALRRYRGRDQARCLAFIVEQMRERCGWTGVYLSPAVLKALLREPPEQVLAAGAESLVSGELPPFWTTLYEALIAAMRRAADLLGPEDLFELERGTALAELGQRVALRQVLRGIAMLDALVSRHPPRVQPGGREVPTPALDEDTFPVGGFSSLSTRGTIESLLHSQLAFMEKEERPDLFDLKYLRDELLYYARDENQFYRRRRTFLFALWPDLVDTRVKDADQPFQRGMLLLAWLVVLIRRLLDWLGTDALSLEMIFVDAKEPGALAPERALVEMVLSDLVQNGKALVRRVASVEQLRIECGEQARRGLCHCLTVSTQDRALDIEHVVVSQLRMTGPAPELVGVDPTPTRSVSEGSPLAYASGWCVNPDRVENNNAGLDHWALVLQGLLEAWV
jgi:hypothetical protein